MAEKPIKRSKALMPLSREHHFDLLLAWKLRKGLAYEVAPDRMAAYIRYLDENLMRAHFEDEEKELFSHFPEDQQVQRALAEHRQVRNLVDRIVSGQQQDADSFNALADLVEAHVRFEERELFPYLEGKFSPGELMRIEKAIDEKHQGFQEVWEDPFWAQLS